MSEQINVQIKVLNIKAKWLNKIKELAMSDIRFSDYYDGYAETSAPYSDRLTEIQSLLQSMEKEVAEYHAKIKAKKEKK